MKIYTLIMIKFSFVHYNNFCLSMSEYYEIEFLKSYNFKILYSEKILLFL